MANKYTGLTKAAVGYFSGIFSYINDVRLDMYAYFSGDENIDNLKQELELQKIEYKNLLKSPKNKYKYMDSAIIAGLTLPEMLKNGVSEDVQLAISYLSLIKQMIFLLQMHGIVLVLQMKGLVVNAIKGVI